MDQYERNYRIRHLRSIGWTYKRIGDVFLLSKQRIKQIIDESEDHAEIAARNRYMRRRQK